MVNNTFGWHSGALTAKSIHVLDTLQIDGDMTFGDAGADTLTIAGAATFGSTVAVTGAVTLSSTLGVSGKITADDVDLASGAIIAGLGESSNGIVIKNLKNSDPTSLSGSQKDIEIDNGGSPYYFTVYPTKA